MGLLDWVPNELIDPTGNSPGGSPFTTPWQAAEESAQEARDTLQAGIDWNRSQYDQYSPELFQRLTGNPEDAYLQGPLYQAMLESYLNPQPGTNIEVPQGLRDVAGSLTSDNFQSILSDITAPGITRGRERMARYGLENSNVPFEQMYVSATGAALFPELQKNVIGASQAIAEIEHYNQLNDTQRAQLHDNLGQMLTQTLQAFRGQDLQTITTLLNAALGYGTQLNESLAGLPTADLASMMAGILSAQAIWNAYSGGSAGGNFAGFGNTGSTSGGGGSPAAAQSAYGIWGGGGASGGAFV